MINAGAAVSDSEGSESEGTDSADDISEEEVNTHCSLYQNNYQLILIYAVRRSTHDE